MDKNTLLAVILSAVVLVVGMVLIYAFFPPASPEIDNSRPSNETELNIEQPPETANAIQKIPANPIVETDETIIEPELQIITEKTGVFSLVFSNKGAAIESVKLLHHLEEGEPIDLIFSGNSGESAFNMKFGGFDGATIDDLFEVGNIEHYNVNGEKYLKSIEFLRNYLDRDGNSFSLSKTYIFGLNDYLFEIEISIKKDKDFGTPPSLDFNGISYTLFFGPQIGPKFDSLNSRYEYRKYYTYSGDKRHTEKIDKKSNTAFIDKKLYWASIVGRYFTIVGVPGYGTGGEYDTLFIQEPGETVSTKSYLAFQRSVIQSSDQTDSYMFYIGPKELNELKKYNDPQKNDFISYDIGMDKIVDTGGILGWLEWLLKQGLFIFYKIIPNYGIAIILLTIFIKLLFFPITHKSFESTSKMSALGPKMNELKEKYKNNPQKLNTEMAALYKKEGVNPLGGCLPMLLQFPIFIALYQLLNKQFELRGAPFFLWINDLSAPESLINFGSFKIPLVGINDLRLLPILYVLSQILSTKMMQNPQTAATNNNNMKFMKYMPLIFFFILYNAPSGLLLYWTVSNILSGVLQYFITKRYRKKHETD